MKCPVEHKSGDDLVRTFMHTSRIFSMILRPGPRDLPGEASPNPHHFFLLNFLRRHGEHNPVSQAEIGADMRLAPPTITLMLNDLEKEGYVARTRDTQDRRIVRVKLTSDGDRMLAEQFEHYRTRMSRLLENLGHDDAEKLIELMQRAIDYMREVDENSSSGK